MYISPDGQLSSYLTLDSDMQVALQAEKERARGLVAEILKEKKSIMEEKEAVLREKKQIENEKEQVEKEIEKMKVRLGERECQIAKLEQRLKIESDTNTSKAKTRDTVFCSASAEIEKDEIILILQVKPPTTHSRIFITSMPQEGRHEVTTFRVMVERVSKWSAPRIRLEGDTYVRRSSACGVGNFEGALQIPDSF